MKKNHAVLRKCVSGVMACAMALSFAPSIAALAEEGAVVETEYAETELLDTGIVETESPETEAPAVFVVTGFPEFEKDAEGNYLDTVIQEKYGSLTAACGTAEEELGLPEDLQIEGYWEANGAEAGTEILTLTDMEWRSGSETDPVGEPAYSETMPAGEYVFYPDFTEYLTKQAELGNTTFAEIKMEEGISLLELKINVTDPAETETEAQTQAAETENADADPTYAETEYVETDPAYAETEYVETDPAYAETEYVETENTAADQVYVETEYADSTQTEYDYINNTNDALIGAEGSDISVNGETQAEETAAPETTAATESETTATETAAPETTATETTATETTATETTATETTATETTATETTATETTATETTATETTATETAASETAATEAPDLAVTFTVSDGVTSYTYENTDTNNTVTLKQSPATGENSASITLSCASSLDIQSLSVTFYDASMTNVIASAPTDGQNFTDGTAKEFVLTDASGNTYAIQLTVQKTQHTWQDATCTAPKTCTVCGTTEGEALGHDWQDATCTQAKTCKRCSITEGEALGHDWQDATCTEPKTCARCSATEGKALGHDLQDEWQTVTASTDTTHGTAVRYCNRTGCDYSETKSLNIIGDPSANSISGIEEGQNYSLDTVLTFTASGAAMGNTSPINGDVRYVPSSWTIQNTPGSFKDNFSGSFSISQSGRYVLAVTFQKQIYQDGWQVTDIVDERTVTFTVGNVISATPADGTADGIKINPQTGDSTPIGAFAAILVAAAAVLAGVVIYRKKRK